MNAQDVIPTSYEQWRHCIEVKCKIRLTSSYVSERLKELQNRNNARTKEFARVYGAEHLERTISWFRRASEEASGKAG
ncbi:MAG: hypothetical protein AAGG48_23025 [Planctomycetota bacterium]